ncbi:YaaR family protein [Helicovermis profundi]|uniref:YaaR family protein n=1 Tax=Helicovermis profundi TaxID=3065157 RepID=A0AAU9EJC0_9FIRM|nr:YaaR family protein [Clostridia bacterium S502]
MKISKTKKAKGVGKNTKAKAKKTVPSISFIEVLSAKEDDDAREKLEEILDVIEEKGKNLYEKRTVESLLDYKKMVKSFIEEAVEFGLKIEEKRGFSRGGRGRILRTVSNIDSKLTQLTDAILKKEKKQINLLEKIGEIQGLLVSIYL